jgi:hypothetical protein
MHVKSIKRIRRKVENIERRSQVQIEQQKERYERLHWPKFWILSSSVGLILYTNVRFRVLDALEDEAKNEHKHVKAETSIIEKDTPIPRLFW